jgi:hypothetical protein
MICGIPFLADAQGSARNTGFPEEISGLPEKIAKGPE